MEPTSGQVTGPARGQVRSGGQVKQVVESGRWSGQVRQVVRVISEVSRFLGAEASYEKLFSDI